MKHSLLLSVKAEGVLGYGFSPHNLLDMLLMFSITLCLTLALPSAAPFLTLSLNYELLLVSFLKLLSFGSLMWKVKHEKMGSDGISCLFHWMVYFC